MEPHVRVVSAAVRLLELRPLLLIDGGGAETIRDVLFQPLVRLGCVFREGNTQMTLVTRFASVLKNMLAVSKGEPAHRPCLIPVPSPEKSEPQSGQDRPQPPPCPFFSGARLPFEAEIRFQRLSDRLNRLVGGKLRTDFDRLQKLPVDQIRKTRVLAHGMMEMTAENPVRPADLQSRCRRLQHPARVLAPEIREHGALVFLEAEGCIFHRDPEKALIEALIRRLMKGMVVRQQLLPVIMTVNRSDDAVPVELRAALLVIDAEAGSDRVVPRPVPDQIRRSLLLKFRQLHPAHGQSPAVRHSFPAPARADPVCSGTAVLPSPRKRPRCHPVF